MFVRRFLTLAIVIPFSTSTLTLDVFPNTVLAPLSAASRSFPATVALPPEGLPPFTSARFTGMLTSPFSQLLNITAAVAASSQLRVWVDNHILLDCLAGRGGGGACVPIANLPVSAGAPVQLRV
jgi:hypothetical protein